MRADILFKEYLNENQILEMFDNMYGYCLAHNEFNTCICYRCKTEWEKIYLKYYSDNKVEYGTNGEYLPSTLCPQDYLHQSDFVNYNDFLDFKKRFLNKEVVIAGIIYKNFNGDEYIIINNGIDFEGKGQSFIEGTDYFKVYEDYFRVYRKFYPFREEIIIPIEKIKIYTANSDSESQIAT